MILNNYITVFIYKEFLIIGGNSLVMNSIKIRTQNYIYSMIPTIKLTEKKKTQRKGTEITIVIFYRLWNKDLPFLYSFFFPTFLKQNCIMDTEKTFQLFSCQLTFLSKSEDLLQFLNQGVANMIQILKYSLVFPHALIFFFSFSIFAVLGIETPAWNMLDKH